MFVDYINEKQTLTKRIFGEMGETRAIAHTFCVANGRYLGLELSLVIKSPGKVSRSVNMY
jgi:hypothetical protein